MAETEPILEVESNAEWDRLLAANHANARGVLLRLAQKGGSISYAEALDVALSWGWIDSQKRALDSTAWLQRFTTRTAKSPWSKINRAKAEALLAAGKLEPPGRAEVERARNDGRWDRVSDGARDATVQDDLAAAL